MTLAVVTLQGRRRFCGRNPHLVDRAETVLHLHRIVGALHDAELLPLPVLRTRKVSGSGQVSELLQADRLKVWSDPRPRHEGRGISPTSGGSDLPSEFRSHARLVRHYDTLHGVQLGDLLPSKRPARRPRERGKTEGESAFVSVESRERSAPPRGLVLVSHPQGPRGRYEGQDSDPDPIPSPPFFLLPRSSVAFFAFELSVCRVGHRQAALGRGRGHHPRSGSADPPATSCPRARLTDTVCLVRSPLSLQIAGLIVELPKIGSWDDGSK